MKDLERLTSDAVDAHWSATGRPKWLEMNGGDVDHAYLTARVVEGPNVLRCLATLRPRGSGDLVAFTLDVSRREFDRLPTLTPIQVVGLLHDALAAAPFLPLDSAPDPGREGCSN
ncbi:hypothetical protein PWY87_22220 [Kribbella solani]|uniref:hypothetical protein n=1 Tax=Kribbella solani TaxID=236067 RepID=UPI0029A165B7|nr:hypothetical protein [Kribbella solani]MDX3004421.1 hypothetical protein [Kribbella solani]